MKPIFGKQNNKYWAYHKYEEIDGKFKSVKKMLNSRVRQFFKNKLHKEEF